jgi:adenylate kinase
MKTKKNIIFVGGIHGVGKTTLCKKISKELSIDHFSSSDLISMLDLRRVKQDKKVDNIRDNQNMLLESVKCFLDNDKVYLLDGHFSLIDSDNFIQEIPIEVFELLGIRGIIILFDYEEKILERLKGRDNRDYSLQFIRNFQEKEISYAKQVAEKIKVPIRIIDISKEESDITFSVKKLL